MLEVRKYSIAELSTILGSTGKQAIDRKLERYGVEYTSTGRGQSLVYDITKISDPFKVYCITKLGIPAQANFEKIRNLYYYFFCDEKNLDSTERRHIKNTKEIPTMSKNELLAKREVLNK